MQFPIECTFIFHAHGGRILRITGIGHDIDKPREGRSWDRWFYRGDVAWDDGGKSIDIEIAPFQFSVPDEGREQWNALSDAMMEYLNANGQWCGRETKHEGWYANQRKRA